MSVVDIAGWVQNLSVGSKAIFTAVLSAMFVGLVWLIWFAPKLKTEKTPSNAAVAMDHSAASIGQTGGMTVGTYINAAPPITEQQKEEALLRLQSEIDELADFPSRPYKSSPPTLLESLSTSSLPHQLYVVLDRYYKQTIVSVPKMGAELYAFRVSYYNFQIAEISIENDLVVEIGKHVSVRFRQAWELYFRYFLARSAGLSQAQIIEGGNFLNYGMTWDDAERVYHELAAKPDISSRMAQSLSKHMEMLSLAQFLVGAYAHK